MIDKNSQNIIPFNGMWNFKAKDTQAFFFDPEILDDIWSDVDKIEKFKTDTFLYYETILNCFIKNLIVFII